MCAVHCVKTGRQWYWVWIIVLFSVIGALAYFLVEIAPSLGGSSAVRSANRAVTNIIDPDRELRARGANFAISNNVDSTCKYADQLIQKGKYEEAINIYKDARKGLFQYDPLLLKGLARVYFTTRQFGECSAVLVELMQHNPDHRNGDNRLLYAMALEEDGRLAEAQREYEAIIDSYPGPEAKCRYAQLLQKQGANEQALALFRDINLVATNAPKHYQRLHKEWIVVAQNAIKASEQRGKAAR
jgi:hypothetical protein